MIKHFEKVIITASARFPEYIGREGIVLGISEEGDQVYGYSVFFTGEDEGVHFLPGELRGTGEYVERSEIYDEHDHVRVRMDGDEGSISD
jgi:hypothetical protein